MPGPLEGVKVLDLTWVLSGPYASMVLCDLGAEVIKVERPGSGDIARTTGPFINDESCYFFSINRGKKSITINLRTEKGKRIFLDLVKQFDVLMENFVPGTMDRLGLGYEVIKEHNPRIVYAACSGFGQTGPDAQRPALDIIVQGMGGIISVTGHPGGPPTRPGLSLGDIAAGLFTAVGVLAALHECARSGQGQMVDVSMLDCQVAIQENAFMRYFATGQVPGPLGTRHPAATPFQAFPTKDGYIVLALSWGQENMWEMYCALIGRPDLIDDERFETSWSRTQHHAILEPILSEAMKARTTAEWLEELQAIGMPCGPLNTIPQAAQEPQIVHRQMLVDIHHPKTGTLKVANSPVKLSRTPTKVSEPPPDLGQHTEEVLSRYLGLSAPEMARLKEEGVI